VRAAIHGTDLANAHGVSLGLGVAAVGAHTLKVVEVMRKVVAMCSEHVNRVVL
jgi:predicted RNA methylase